MKKLICSLASAALIAALLPACSNVNDFSNLFGESNKTVAVDQKESLPDLTAQVEKADLPTLQKESDAYKTAIADKTTELNNYQTQLNEISLSQMLGDKAMTLKDNIAKTTQDLSDLNKKLQVILDQIQSLQK